MSQNTTLIPDLMTEEMTSTLLTPSENATLQTVMRIICPVSLLANISLLAAVLYFRSTRTSLCYLQSFLAVTDAALSIGWIIGTSITSDATACTVVGTIFQFCLNASSCWNFLASLYCYLTILWGAKVADRWWGLFHLYGWGLPSVLTVALYIAQAGMLRGSVFGDAEYECWIAPSFPELRIAMFYPFLWLHFLLITLFHVLIFSNISQVTSEIAAAAASSATAGNATIQHKQTFESAASSLDRIESPHGGSEGNIRSPPNSSAFSLLKIPGAGGGIVGTGVVEGVSGGVTLEKGSSTVPHASQGGSDVKSPPMYPGTAFGNNGARGTLPRTLDKTVPQSPSPQSKLKASMNRLFAKTLILACGFLLSWTPATAVRIIGLIGGYIPFWLHLLVGVGFSMCGLWNPVAYFVSICMGGGTGRLGH
ncbi:family A G protein-coupled receptor-like protein [Rhizoclosmatium globosum]|uniref:Family A G protein-coupled receptor-like protein n=1 Tax=Rhizoclosmatium globosum TaxID=329046 RepID=A0A1Y2C8D3_9FUNG|nr:family A G protein-coupled receptor-like protein [Rhizoclosmatium globosum]|eukprot:ORY43293.1 family A G protein-coupled receptor-like protein [Rhizoclosmatium globosum]